MVVARVASLHCYPIKSCRGIALDEALVGARGIANDRRFMVVDDDGTFRSQRKDPRLALVSTRIDGSMLHVAADGHGDVVIDLATTDDPEAPRVRARVHRDEVRTVDQGGGAAAFFSELLGAGSRLVALPGDERRPARWTSDDATTHEVSLADAAPLLLTSHASLRALQLEIEEPIPIERFRANIVVEAAEPWAEEQWRELHVGETELAFAAQCTRCTITTTDQHTGARGEEPLRTLARVRRTDAGAVFGIYLLPRTTGTVIRAGDDVQATTADSVAP
jgi:uncharacterized protein YcbX